MRTRMFVMAALAAAVVACGKPAVTEVGILTDPLSNSAWDVSQWISVVDAPIAPGPSLGNDKSAPGSSWFLSTVTNEKKVTTFS